MYLNNNCYVCSVFVNTCRKDYLFEHKFKDYNFDIYGSLCPPLREWGGREFRHVW